ncbi:MAG: response regulator [Acidobacteria bacterium]|nr:response regulator [Acidobacteriota bacterium]
MLLLVSSRELPGLLRILSGTNGNILLAGSVREALQRLCAPANFNLIIADAELPDGSWEDLLSFLTQRQKPCEIVVCSRRADEQFWVEVIAHGAFDLLAEPYDEREVVRIIHNALARQPVQELAWRKAA